MDNILNILQQTYIKKNFKHIFFNITYLQINVIYIIVDFTMVLQSIQSILCLFNNLHIFDIHFSYLL